MCGISGWFCWGDKRPKPHTIKGLLLANMERGTSATGMAYLGDKGHIIVRKGKGPASDFIANTTDEEFELAAQSSRGLLHARATTKGSENANENNHPVVGLGWVAIHNGSIGNDDDLWGYYAEKEGVKRFAEVDTSVIPLMLSRGESVEDSIKKLSALSGTLTIAAWSEQDKDRMLIGRFGHNDLHMFYDAGSHILYWSSAPSAGYVMKGILMGRHKFLTLSRLADEHVLLLSPDGLDATRVFKVARRPFYAARKGVTSSKGGTTSHSAGSGSSFKPAQESAQPFIALPPARNMGSGRLSSQASGATLSPASTTGWKEITSREKVKYLQAEKDYIKVMFAAPTDALMLCASWKPTETGNTKPSPTSDIFGKVWWNLNGILHALTAPKDPLITSVIKESAYGRWEIGIDKDKQFEMQFRGHKRVKDWWDRLYRTRFKFPLTINKEDEKTELCDHLAWEHYDIHLQKIDKSTHSFLGFMCPWCGVWMSSTRVQEMKYRCEFCCIRSRTQPAAGGAAYG